MKIEKKTANWNLDDFRDLEIEFSSPPGDEADGRAGQENSVLKWKKSCWRGYIPFGAATFQSCVKISPLENNTVANGTLRVSGTVVESTKQAWVGSTGWRVRASSNMTVLATDVASKQTNGFKTNKKRLQNKLILMWFEAGPCFF